MKKIYEFTVNKIVEVPEEVVSVNESGAQVKTITQVEKEVPHKFFIKKPSRAMSDEASLFYGVKFAEATKAGMLTIPMIEKRNISDGGVFSDKEKAEYLKLFDDLATAEKSFQPLDLIKEEARTEEEKTKHKEYSDKIKELRIRAQEIESYRTSIYDHTAEVRARNLTVTWWLLHLSYAEPEPNKFVSYFGEGDYNARLDRYEEIAESEDKFSNKVLNKFLALVSFWATNRASSKEEFERIEKLFDSIS